ncbi:MAG: MbnP family protein, partial [Roseimicrobium sp.]
MHCTLRALYFWLFLAGAWPSSLGHAANLHGVIRFEVQGQTLLLDSLRYQTEVGEVFSITRSSWLASGFALRRSDGTWLELPGHVAWLDATRQRAEFFLPAIPSAKYTALRFHVGLDAATNAADPARYEPSHPLNPNVNGLHWSWQGGYIFLALEGSWRSKAGALGGFSYHFARDANRTAIVLPGEMDLSGDASAELVFDVAAVLRGARPLSFAKDGVSTHAHPGDPIAAALGANLPGAFSLKSVTSHVPPIARPSTVKPIDLP